MDYTVHDKTLLINEKSSAVILYFLLFIRLIDQYLPIWIFENDVPVWFGYWYAGILYVMSVVLVYLNKHRLAMLNVDIPFIFILIFGGVLYMLYFPITVGILIGMALWLLYRVLRDHQSKITAPHSYPKVMRSLILASVALAIAPAIIYAPTLKHIISVQTFVESFLNAQLALVAFEELLFRGLFWTYLRERGVKESAIYLLQAFLFWIAHHRFLLLNNAYAFWVTVPITALLYGYMVWRSKSLTPSTIGHFLFNLTGLVLKQIF